MSHVLSVQRRGGVKGLGLGLIVALVCLHVAVQDASALGSRSARIASLKLDTSQDGSHQGGPWTYEYSISSKGTRSQGYHGKLLFNGNEVPEPANLNDYYKTPWGPMYWVGRPVVLFGNHGWMSTPLAREVKGKALMDPAKLAGRVFTLRVKVLASEELATPDRIETDPKALAALSPFDLKQAHVQRNWFRLAQTWNSLHDTKRWGHLEMRVAPSDPNRPLALEFRSTGDFTLTTPSQLNSLAALIPPERSGKSEFVELPPQVGAVRAIQCTLTPVVGDALELFLVCHVEKSRKQP
jgi:hypothetical protein